MRSRVLLFALLLTVVLFALPHAVFAKIPFFGPIIPEAQSVCPASWGLVITVINNCIEFLITIAIVFVAPVMIAYAGFLYVVNPMNPSGISKARGILQNTVIGIVVALSAWLIVAAVMAVLYNPKAVGKTWTELITSGGIEPCLVQEGALYMLNQTKFTGITATGGTPAGKTRGVCLPGNTACSPAAIQQAAQTLGLTLSSEQQAAMSCIAMTESSGNPNTPDSNTGACGTFQITNRPGNWANPSLHRSPCSTTSSCNNAQCNLQTALLLYSKRGYQPWTGKNQNGTYWNPNAVACVQEYNPGGRI